MTIRAVRAEAERRSADTSGRIETLAEVLTSAAANKHPRRCTVCGGATGLEPAFVVPVGYVASRLVLNGLEAAYGRLPLRRGFLCDRHRDHFRALLVEVADPCWDLERLEARAAVLGGVLAGGLLVFGGAKALALADEFHAALAALKRRVFGDSDKDRL